VSVEKECGMQQLCWLSNLCLNNLRNTRWLFRGKL